MTLKKTIRLFILSLLGCIIGFLIGIYCPIVIVFILGVFIWYILSTKQRNLQRGKK